MESKSSMRSLLVCKQIPERKFQFTEWFNKNVNRCDLIEIKLVLRYLEQFKRFKFAHYHSKFTEFRDEKFSINENR